MLAFDSKDRISFPNLFDHPLFKIPEIEAIDENSEEDRDEYKDEEPNYSKTINALVISEKLNFPQ